MLRNRFECFVTKFSTDSQFGYFYMDIKNSKILLILLFLITIINININININIVIIIIIIITFIIVNMCVPGGVTRYKKVSEVLVRVILPQQKSRVYGNCMQF